MYMYFLDFCKFHEDPIKMNEISAEHEHYSHRDGHCNTIVNVLKIIIPGDETYTNMYITLKPLDMIYLFTYTTLKIRKIAVCFHWLSLPGHYRVPDEALLAETT